MNADCLGHWHDYAVDSSVAERRTRIVIGITATMMVVEIAAGVVFGSTALLADGWHRSTHVAAFLITAVAYHFSRCHAAGPRYSFGTGKMGVLGGFASAVVLARSRDGHRRQRRRIRLGLRVGPGHEWDPVGSCTGIVRPAGGNPPCRGEGR